MTPSATTYFGVVLGLLVFVGIAACSRLGWEGLAVPAALWILMPQVKVSP